MGKDETMSREPGKPPQFDRMINDLRRAQEAWQYGDIVKAERILKLVASIAYAESEERGENDPMPENGPLAQ